MAHNPYYDDPHVAQTVGMSAQQVSYAPHPAHDPRVPPHAGGGAHGAHGTYPVYGAYPDNHAQGEYAQPVSAGGGSGLGAAMNWAGALVSLGLVVGMGVWAWQLTVRDVSGVPVIRALEGPMRIAPENPGGSQAEHQGLAVNRIAEGAEAAPVPDRLVLAPPPVELDDIEIAAAEAANAPVGAASSETQALINRLLTQGGALDESPELERAELGSNVEPTLEQTTPATASADAAVVIPASVPGVARSLRPIVRPATLQVASSSLGTAPTAPAAEGNELSLADLPEGTRLVQLGAFDSPDLARAEWQRLATAFPDFFIDRARVIEQASSGGQAFFRLRAHGFDDLADSRRFCAVLVAQGVGCIPVSVR